MKTPCRKLLSRATLSDEDNGTIDLGGLCHALLEIKIYVALPYSFPVSFLVHRRIIPSRHRISTHWHASCIIIGKESI